MTLLRFSPAGALALALAIGLAGCASSPPPPPPPAKPPAPVSVAPPPPAPAPEPPFTGKVSHATNDREYRRDGAQHLYGLYGERIFQGKLPPLLQAVGVMRLDIGPRGELRHFEWMRAPDHVPHVKAEIERLVRAAAPFPAPRQLGGVSYTDTWLWDRSGTFQLDTLTEGQLDRLPTPTRTAKPAKEVRKPVAKAPARKAPGTSVAQGDNSGDQLPR